MTSELTWRTLGVDELSADELTAWNAVTRAQSPLADLTWTRCFSAAFGAPRVHALYRDGRPVVALPLVHAAGPARAWISLDNEHNPYWLCAGTPDAATVVYLLGHALEGADYLYLRRIPLTGATCNGLTRAAEELGLAVSAIESEHGDARLALPATWDALWRSLPRNLQRDLPRKQRQLQRRGKLEMIVLSEPGPELEGALGACFDLETRGWKGESGSPIRSDPQTLRFYTELARAMAAAGRFALYLLQLDGRLIAFEYCLRGGGHIEMLKLSFDPAFGAQSPDQVLRVLALRREVERGEIRYYHLGRPSPWKLRWASEIAPLGTLRIYGRGVRARAAYVLGPVLRGRLKRSPLAVAARDRLRALRARRA